MLGVEPWDYTLRELSWMADGRQRSVWQCVSLLAACALNANPFREEPIEPDDINPYAQPKQLPSADGIFDSMRRDGFFG